MKYKICTKCGVEKPLSEFYKDKLGKFGFAAKCKLCVSEYSRLRNLIPDVKIKIAAYGAIYSRKNEARAKALARGRTPEYRSVKLAYRKTDSGMESQRLGGIARRARYAGAEGFHRYADILALLKHQNSKCICCKVSLKIVYHIDHIRPLSKGGSNWPDNLQLLCPTCNLQKNARDPVEFMQSKGFLI